MASGIILQSQLWQKKNATAAEKKGKKREERRRGGGRGEERGLETAGEGQEPVWTLEWFRMINGGKRGNMGGLVPRGTYGECTQ